MAWKPLRAGKAGLCERAAADFRVSFLYVVFAVAYFGHGLEDQAPVGSGPPIPTPKLIQPQ